MPAPVPRFPIATLTAGFPEPVRNVISSRLNSLQAHSGPDAMGWALLDLVTHYRARLA